MLGLLVVRVALAMMSAEAGLRFAVWWWRIKNGGNPLRATLAGVSLVQSALAIFAVMAIVANPARPITWLVATGDVLLFVGTVFHLIPCWKISNGWGNRRIAIEVICRVVLAVCLGAARLSL